MAKLNKQEFDYYLAEYDQTIKYKKVPGFVLAGKLKQLNGIKDESVKTEKTLLIYLELINDYTDLENSLEELKETLSLDEINELGDLIAGASKTTEKGKNFMKAQS